jgi:hypothetical protein
VKEEVYDFIALWEKKEVKRRRKGGRRSVEKGRSMNESPERV